MVSDGCLERGFVSCEVVASLIVSVPREREREREVNFACGLSLNRGSTYVEEVVKSLHERRLKNIDNRKAKMSVMLT